MSTASASSAAERRHRDRLLGAARPRGRRPPASRRAVAQQHRARALELLAARPRGRVVERERQVGRAAASSRRSTTVPRLQPVRQRDHAEVVAERRPDARRGGLHRRQPRDDAHVDAAKRRRRLERLSTAPPSRRSRVAGGDDRDARAGAASSSACARALGLDAVVAGVAAAARAAPARGRGRSRSRRARRRAASSALRLRGQPAARPAGPRPDDARPAPPRRAGGARAARPPAHEHAATCRAPRRVDVARAARRAARSELARST